MSYVFAPDFRCRHPNIIYIMSDDHAARTIGAYDDSFIRTPNLDGVRTDRYKLIHFYTDDVWEFYDLDSDPLEVDNVHGRPEYASEIAAMKDEYERLKRRFEVPEEAFARRFADFDEKGTQNYRSLSAESWISWSAYQSFHGYA